MREPWIAKAKQEGVYERFELHLGDGTHVLSLEDGEKIARDILGLLDIDVAKLETIKEACEMLFEKDDDGVAKYIKVEGEGDTWWIPEAIGLMMLTALKEE